MLSFSLLFFQLGLFCLRVIKLTLQRPLPCQASQNLVKECFQTMKLEPFSEYAFALNQESEKFFWWKYFTYMQQGIILTPLVRVKWGTAWIPTVISAYLTYSDTYIVHSDLLDRFLITNWKFLFQECQEVYLWLSMKWNEWSTRVLHMTRNIITLLPHVKQFSA